MFVGNFFESLCYKNYFSFLKVFSSLGSVVNFIDNYLYILRAQQLCILFFRFELIYYFTRRVSDTVVKITAFTPILTSLPIILYYFP